MGDGYPSGKRGRPAAVEPPAGCKRASWKTRKKPGAGNRPMTPPPTPLELRNRFQALTEEDSGDETESEQDGSTPTPWEGPSASSHLLTSTHTGSRVKADGEREPSQGAPRKGDKRPKRTKKSPVTGSAEAEARAQEELTPAGPEQPIGQTQQSVLPIVCLREFGVIVTKR